MSWVSVIDPSARKGLANFPAKDRERIIDIIEKEMCLDPFSGDILKMSGEDSWRRRIGNYRIEYELYKEDGRDSCIFNRTSH